MFINLGTKDGFYKASFLQFILDESNLKKEVLGKIDMRDMNSWVEIDKVAADKHMNQTIQIISAINAMPHIPISRKVETDIVELLK